MRQLCDAWKAAEQLGESAGWEAPQGDEVEGLDTSQRCRASCTAARTALLAQLPELWPSLDAVGMLPMELQPQLAQWQQQQEEQESEKAGAATGRVGPPVEQQLHVLLHYLRETHLYCLYCGATYASREEMSANCPGESADDH